MHKALLFAILFVSAALVGMVLGGCQPEKGATATGGNVVVYTNDAPLNEEEPPEVIE